MALSYPFARPEVRGALMAFAATVALSACGGEDTGEIAGPAPTPSPASSTAPASAAPATTAPAKPATAEPAKPATAKPTSSRLASTRKPSTTGGVLSGTRQVVIAPVPSFESVLALDSRGRLNLTDGEGSRSLFVFVPAGKSYLIKTAKADAGSGEPLCLSIKVNGSNPLTVVATACDAGAAAQRFEVTARGKTYAISNRSAFLQVVKGELIAEELGDAPLGTTYKLVDNGKASLPALD
jgi:hypothetical protein